MARSPSAPVVVILAAGHGKRLGSDQPKALTPILGRTSIGYVLRAARSLRPARVVVVIGVGGKEVRDSLASEPGLDFVEQAELLGTGHALLQAVRQLEGAEGGGDSVAPGVVARDVVALYGDSPLVTVELLERLLRVHREEQAQATMVTADLGDPTGYGRIIRNEDGVIVRVIEERDADEATRAISEVNSGISCFRLEGLRDDLDRLDNRNAQDEYYLTDIFGVVREGAGRVAAVRARSEAEVLGFNSPEELARVREMMRCRIVARHMAAGVDIPAPQTVVVDDTVEIGAQTRILPFCVISGVVRIGQRCEVGPFTHLRAGAVLEDEAEVGNYVEVKKSRIGAATKAKHLTYLGDTEIGPRANIGAGTITANYDGKDKHRTVIGAGAFIGSGTILVAPVDVGRNALTGAGAVVLRGHTVPDGAVVVGVPARVLTRGSDAGGGDSREGTGVEPVVSDTVGDTAGGADSDTGGDPGEARER